MKDSEKENADGLMRKLMIINIEKRMDSWISEDPFNESNKPATSDIMKNIAAGKKEKLFNTICALSFVLFNH